MFWTAVAFATAPDVVPEPAPDVPPAAAPEGTPPAAPEATAPAPPEAPAPCDLACELARETSWRARDARIEQEIAAGGDRRRLLGVLSALDDLKGLGVEDPGLIERCMQALLSDDPDTRTNAIAAVRESDTVEALARALVGVLPARVDAPPAAAAPAPAAPPEPAPIVYVGGLPLATKGGLAETTLENGVHVTVVGDPSVSLVAVVHHFDAGAADEAEGEAGVAHLVEHLLFEPSGDGATGSFLDHVRETRGFANAWTSHDATTYLTQVPPEALLPTLDREAARIATLDPPAPILERERAVVADEHRLRFALDPRARIEVALDQALLADHPYGRPVSGGAAFAQVSAEAVRAFHARSYGGGRLHVVIVGPLEAVPVAEAVAARYAALPTAPVERPVPPVHLGDERIVVRAEGARANEVGLAWALPPGRPCPPEGPTTDRPCTTTYWADQVVLALFAGEGADAIGQALSMSTGSFTPVRVRVRQDASGGYVALTAPRSSPVGIALTNIGSGLVQVIGGVGGVMIPMPYRANPRPGMLERVLAEDPDWITDEAITEAREAVLRDELSRVWSADARALGLAAKTALGLAADESVTRRLAELDADQVRARYREIFGEGATVVRVR